MEPSLMTTISRWQKEARMAKSREGHMWYTEALAAHKLNLHAEANTWQYVPLVVCRLLASQPSTNRQTDADGFEMQNKHAQNAHSSNFTDGTPICQQALAAQNKFNPLAMDVTDDSTDDSTNTNDSTNDSIYDQSTNIFVGSPSHIPGRQSSF
ncbi:hypothetical protein FBU31_003649 [Coemansia sp. 'formosensis']|nr:hypothetical protein FBU31_003649 [Coemansia sp. 'formosensis']